MLKMGSFHQDVSPVIKNLCHLFYIYKVFLRYVELKTTKYEEMHILLWWQQ